MEKWMDGKREGKSCWFRTIWKGETFSWKNRFLFKNFRSKNLFLLNFLLLHLLHHFLEKKEWKWRVTEKTWNFFPLVYQSNAKTFLQLPFLYITLKTSSVLESNVKMLVASYLNLKYILFQKRIDFWCWMLMDGEGIFREMFTYSYGYLPHQCLHCKCYGMVRKM